MKSTVTIRYRCFQCGHKEHVMTLKSMDKSWTKLPDQKRCSECDSVADLSLKHNSSRTVMFQSYTDTDITGSPIEITSPKQRDKVLAEHGCTMDSLSNPKRGGTRDEWEKDIQVEDVLQHIDKHGIEAPINAEDSL